MLSIVIPARNEVDSLEPLHREIDSVLGASALQAEIVIVDDGSTDGTWSGSWRWQQPIRACAASAFAGTLERLQPSAPPLPASEATR